MLAQKRILVRSFQLSPLTNQRSTAWLSTIPSSSSRSNGQVNKKNNHKGNPRKRHPTKLHFAPKEYTCLSYYRFIPIADESISGLIARGKEVFTPYPEIKGTILIATEGINGAFAVPTQSIPLFKNLMRTINPTIFGNIDYNYGTKLAHVTPMDSIFPFRKLLIKRRKEVLTDRIPDLNWQDAGPELPPAEWHEELKTLKTFDEAIADPKEAILLGIDCLQTTQKTLSFLSFFHFLLSLANRFSFSLSFLFQNGENPLSTNYRLS